MNRIYKVTVLHGSDLVPTSFLCSAISPGKAQKHISRKFINVKLATAHDVAELMAGGAKIETAPEQKKKPTTPEQLTMPSPEFAPVTEVSVDPEPLLSEEAQP